MKGKRNNLTINISSNMCQMTTLFVVPSTLWIQKKNWIQLLTTCSPRCFPEMIFRKFNHDMTTFNLRPLLSNHRAILALYVLHVENSVNNLQELRSNAIVDILRFILQCIQTRNMIYSVVPYQCISKYCHFDCIHVG